MTDRTIASLCQRSHELSRSKGWYNGEEKDPRPLRLIALLMQSELIEALEQWRDNKKFDEIYFSYEEGGVYMETPPGHTLKDDAPVEKYKPEGILIELADCIIRICQRCGSDETPLEAILTVSVPRNVEFTDDFETMLATCMADISVSYMQETKAGEQMVRCAGYPTKPEFYWAMTAAGIFAWAEKNKLDLWSAIELKERYNATRPHRHGGKKA
jgi:hypothetical protein